MADTPGEISIILSIRNPGKRRAIKVAAAFFIEDRINVREGLGDKVLEDALLTLQDKLDWALKNDSFRKKNEG